MIAASMMPELIKMAGTVSEKTPALYDFNYQPHIKIAPKVWKASPGLQEKYPTGEMPDPHYPTGMRVAITWQILLLSLITGMSVTAILATVLYLNDKGQLGGIKETLGLKPKRGDSNGVLAGKK